jgi:membrane-bound serine protease (ClpP class)
MVAMLLPAAAGVPDLPGVTGVAHRAAAADGAPAAGGGQLPAARRPVRIRITGPIDGAQRVYIEHRLRKAQLLGADLLILEIDSPGGTLDDSRLVADALLDLNWARSVAYIPREAISGAAFVALACHEIAVHPNARLGDAGPIALTDEGFARVPEKIVSITKTIARTLAGARGRPEALAEAMVRSVKVFRVRHLPSGEEKFLTETEWDEVADSNDWQKIDGGGVPESGGGLYLTVNGSRAVELGLADLLVDDLQALYQHYRLSADPQLLPEQGDFAEGLLLFCSSPWVRFLLLTLGLLGLYLEFTMPGILAGGALSALAFGLFFWSAVAGGTASLLDILLFTSGLLLLAFEVFIIPGFGLPGILGMLLVLVGLLFAGQRSIIPQTKADYVNLRDSVASLVLAGCGFVVAVYFLRRRVGRRGGFFSRLVLQPPEPPPRPSHTEAAGPASDAPDRAPASTRDASAEAPAAVLGQRGQAITALRPAGKARIAGRLRDVLAADGEFIDAGQPVEVCQVHGSVLVVRRVEKA